MRKKRFSAGMIVLNGMPWMPYILKNIYPLFDEIVVLDGAVEKAAEFASPDGHSIDGTVEAIRNFPDPDRKIKYIEHQRIFSEKTELAATCAEACTGDYFWAVDSDEFYKPEDVRWLQQYLIEHPEIGAVQFSRKDFFGGINATVHGGYTPKKLEEWWRVFRWGENYRYIEHRPPTIVDENGVDLKQYPTLSGKDLANKYGIYIYHYSYVFPKQVQQKSRYYYNLSQYYKGKHPLDSWYDKHFVRYTPWRVHKYRRPLSWLEPFKGQHPVEMLELIEDIQSGKVAYEMRPSADIDKMMSSGLWRFWKIIGEIDMVLWVFWDEKLRPILRPFVRMIRARFFGYNYSGK